MKELTPSLKGLSEGGATTDACPPGVWSDRCSPELAQHAVCMQLAVGCLLVHELRMRQGRSAGRSSRKAGLREEKRGEGAGLHHHPLLTDAHIAAFLVQENLGVDCERGGQLDGLRMARIGAGLGMYRRHARPDPSKHAAADLRRRCMHTRQRACDAWAGVHGMPPRTLQAEQLARCLGQRTATPPISGRREE